MDGVLMNQRSDSDASYFNDSEEESRSESHFFDINFNTDLSINLEEKKSERKKPSREKSSLFWPLTEAGQTSGVVSESSSDDVDSICESDMGDDTVEYRKFVDNKDDFDLDGVYEDDEEEGEEDEDDDDEFLNVNLVNVDFKGKGSQEDGLSVPTKTKSTAKFEGGHEDGINRTFSSML